MARALALFLSLALAGAVVDVGLGEGRSNGAGVGQQDRVSVSHWYRMDDQVTFAMTVQMPSSWSLAQTRLFSNGRIITMSLGEGAATDGGMAVFKEELAKLKTEVGSNETSLRTGLEKLLAEEENSQVREHLNVTLQSLDRIDKAKDSNAHKVVSIHVATALLEQEATRHPIASSMIQQSRRLRGSGLDVLLDPAAPIVLVIPQELDWVNPESIFSFANADGHLDVVLPKPPADMLKAPYWLNLKKRADFQPLSVYGLDGQQVSGQQTDFLALMNVTPKSFLMKVTQELVRRRGDQPLK